MERRGGEAYYLISAFFPMDSFFLLSCVFWSVRRSLEPGIYRTKLIITMTSSPRSAHDAAALLPIHAPPPPPPLGRYKCNDRLRRKYFRGHVGRIIIVTVVVVDDDGHRRRIEDVAAGASACGNIIESRASDAAVAVTKTTTATCGGEGLS